MGFSANIKADATSVLQKVPAAYRDEVSNALCTVFKFENWRLSQDPVVEDTPANRLDYVSEHIANMWAAYIIEQTMAQRIIDNEIQTWTDIEGV
jgi:hypothetical protein